MGLIARKPVFGLSNQVMLLPTCSAIDTSYNVEIMLNEVKICCRSDCVDAPVGWSAAKKSGFLTLQPIWVSLLENLPLGFLTRSCSYQPAQL